VFNVTGGELLIILLVALVVLGPEKLPDAVRKAGRLYGELRRMSSGFQAELRDALDEPTREIRGSVNEVKDTFANATRTSFGPEPSATPDTAAVAAAAAAAVGDETAPAAGEAGTASEAATGDGLPAAAEAAAGTTPVDAGAPAEGDHGLVELDGLPDADPPPVGLPPVAPAAPVEPVEPAATSDGPPATPPTVDDDQALPA
jgi:sec-independent protein translocase protein TatB